MINGNLREFFSYGFYSYGFPVFLLNFLVTLPFLAKTGSSYAISIPGILSTCCFLRTLLSIRKILIESAVPTKQRLVGFVLVGMMPGILANAVWFHPDILMSFLIIKTFYYLDNPKTEIGSRSYKLSVLFFALAVSVKIQALSFLPAFEWVFIRSCVINRSVRREEIYFLIYSIIAVIFIYIVLNPFLLKGEGRLA